MFSTPEQYREAKIAGYTDEQIAKFIASERGYDISTMTGAKNFELAAQEWTGVRNDTEIDYPGQQPEQQLEQLEQRQPQRYSSIYSDQQYQNIYRPQKSITPQQLSPEEEAARERAYNAKHMGDTKRGLMGGGHSSAAAIGAIEALFGNLVEKAGGSKVGRYLQEQGMGIYNSQMKKASLYPTTQMTEVKGLGSGIDYVQGLVGSQLPVIFQVVATGGGTGALAAVFAKKGASKIAKQQLISRAAKAGGIAAVTQMESGLNYGDLLTEHNIKAPMSSLAFGVLSGALELLPGGNFGIADKFIDAVISGKGIKKHAASLLKNLRSQVPSETLQESGQGVLSILNTVVNTDEKFLTKEHVGEVLEQGLAGGLFGTGGAFIKTAIPEAKDVKKDAETEFGKNAEAQTADLPLATEEQQAKADANAELLAKEKEVSVFKTAEEAGVKAVGVPYVGQRKTSDGEVHILPEKDIAVVQYETEKTKEAYEILKECLNR